MLAKESEGESFILSAWYTISVMNLFRIYLVRDFVCRAMIGRNHEYAYYFLCIVFFPKKKWIINHFINKT